MLLSQEYEVAVKDGGIAQAVALDLLTTIMKIYSGEMLVGAATALDADHLLVWCITESAGHRGGPLYYRGSV